MKTQPKIINIARDFSPFPAGRIISDGPNSGQKFRQTLLEPALEKHSLVEVQLDGVKGYPSSFTEEAFGGLVRAGHSKHDLKQRLNITFLDAVYSSYREEILQAIEFAQND